MLSYTEGIPCHPPLFSSVNTLDSRISIQRGKAVSMKLETNFKNISIFTYNDKNNNFDLLYLRFTDHCGRVGRKIERARGQGVCYDTLSHTSARSYTQEVS